MLSGLPILSEVIVLFFSMIIYILPGYLLVHNLFPKIDKISEKIVIGASFIVVYWILMGFILSKYELLDSFTSMIILGVTYFFLVWGYIKRRKDGINKVDNSSEDITAALSLILIFLIILLTFYSWEGLEPGIGAWDRGEHHIKSLYLYYHRRLPITEIGTDVDPFYPAGFHLAYFFFSSLPMGIYQNNIANSDTFLAFFMGIVIASLSVVIYSVSNSYFRDIFAGIFGSLSFSLISFLFIFNSMPSSLALILIGSLVLLLNGYKNKDLPNSYLVLCILLFCGVLMVHPIMFLYCLVIVLPLLGYWVMNRDMDRGGLYITLSCIFLSIIFYFLFMLIFKPNLLFGTLNYLGIRKTGSLAVSGVNNPYSIIEKIRNIRYKELIFYLGVLYPLIPFFLVGLVEGYRKARDILIILIFSVFLCIVGVVWYTGRTWFYMLYPSTILCGLGIRKIMGFIGVHKGGVINIFLICILVSLITLSAVSNAFNGRDITGSQYWKKSWRIQTYISQEEFDLVEWINNKNINNELIATPTDSPSYQLIEALSENKILMGSEFKAPESFQDILRFFAENTTVDYRKQIVSYYNISMIVVDDKDTAEVLSNQLKVSNMYHPTAHYWVISLSEKNVDWT